MDPAKLTAGPRPSSGEGGARAALGYVARTPALAIPLAMMALGGTLGFNFQVVLPLFAQFSFDGDPGGYTGFVVALGVGSAIGALAMGARGRVGTPVLLATAVGFGAFALLAAAAPTLELAALALVPLGAVTVAFAAGINSTLQLTASPTMRGRVMALYSVVFLGSTPIGGPISGSSRAPAHRLRRARRRGRLRRRAPARPLASSRAGAGGFGPPRPPRDRR